jgi:hypothetical protein
VDQTWQENKFELIEVFNSSFLLIFRFVHFGPNFSHVFSEDIRILFAIPPRRKVPQDKDDLFLWFVFILVPDFQIDLENCFEQIVVGGNVIANVNEPHINEQSVRYSEREE